MIDENESIICGEQITRHEEHLRRTDTRQERRSGELLKRYKAVRTSTGHGYKTVTRMKQNILTIQSWKTKSIAIIAVNHRGQSGQKWVK